MRHFAKLVLASTFVMGVTGCQWLCPNWCQPGSHEYQRHRAVLHDPYGDNNLAPEIDGGRPREFQLPHAEPVRSQPYQNNYWRGVP